MFCCYLQPGGVTTTPVTMQVQIPKAEHMFLMGPRGQNLKDIYDITGMIEYYDICLICWSFNFVGNASLNLRLTALNCCRQIKNAYVCNITE